MGRGAQKERQLFDFEDISRFGASTLDEHEEAYLRSRAKRLSSFAEQLNEGVETLSQGESAQIFSDIENSIDVKNALRDEEPKAELDELLRALGRAYIARSQGLSSGERVIHLVAAPYAIITGLREPTTPHIVKEEKASGPMLHLREKANDTQALCGYKITPHQPSVFRGSFKVKNATTCHACEQELLGFGSSDPVWKAARETTAYDSLAENEVDLLEEKLAAMSRAALLSGEVDYQLFADTAKTEIISSISQSLLALTPTARLKALIEPSLGSSEPMRKALNRAHKAIKSNYPGSGKGHWPDAGGLAETLSLVRINLPLNVIRCEMAAHLIARYFPLAVRSFYDQMDMNGIPQLGTREISDIWRNHYPELLQNR